MRIANDTTPSLRRARAFVELARSEEKKGGTTLLEHAADNRFAASKILLQLAFTAEDRRLHRAARKLKILSQDQILEATIDLRLSRGQVTRLVMLPKLRSAPITVQVKDGIL